MFRRALPILAAVLLSGASLAAAEQWKFDATPGGLLAVELTTGGSITVQGTAASSVTVEATIHGRDATAVRLVVEPNAKGVTIRSELTRHRASSSASADLVVTVPERYDLELSTMGGEVRLSGIEGKIHGKTMGGSLDLRKIKGNIGLSTMGGEVKVVDSEATGKIETMGGDVHFMNVRGGLSGTTMGGEVRIEGAAAADGAPGEVVRISTMGGEIHVAQAPAGAELQTMGGDILLESAGGPVSATTMGGDVTIRSAASDVKATTMGGNVTVRVVGAGGDVDIDSKGGTLELTLPEGYSGKLDLTLAYTRNSERGYAIKSDFPVSQRQTEEWSRAEGSPRKYFYGTGTIGDGRHTVKMRTVNGDIVIRRAG